MNLDFESLKDKDKLYIQTGLKPDLSPSLLLKGKGFAWRLTNKDKRSDSEDHSEIMKC